MKRITGLNLLALPLLLLCMGSAHAERPPVERAPVPCMGTLGTELMVIPSDTLGAMAADTTEAKQEEADTPAPQEPTLTEKVKRGVSAVRIMTRVAAGLLGEWLTDEVIHPD